MTWFLRATEQPDGTWSCRLGNEHLGVHRHLAGALHQLVEVARELGGRENFSLRLHYADGRVESRPALDRVPGELEA